MSKHTARLTAIQAVKNMDFIPDQDAMERVKGAMAEGPEVFQAKMKAKILDYLDLVSKSQNNPFHPDIQEVVKTHNPEYARKEAGAYPGRTVAVFEGSIYNELQIDTNWMPVFNIISNEGSGSADILDTDSLQVWQELFGEEIKPRAWLQENFSNIRERDFGAGIYLDNRWIETNQTYNINSALRTIADGRLTFQANNAYASIAGGSPSTVTSSAATVDAIITALNTAADALIEANSGVGFAASPQTELLFYYSNAHGDIMSQVIERKLNSTGQVDRLVKRFNIRFIETYNTNFPDQFSSKNAGMLVFPKKKNFWITFKGLMQASEFTFANYKTALMAREWYNYQTPAAQRRIVNMQA